MVFRPQQGRRTVGEVSWLTEATKTGNCLLNNLNGCCCYVEIEILICGALGS